VPAVVRYERQEPGELIRLDTKKLRRIDGIGHRITGRRRSDRLNRGIGWDFVHVAIDDASRLGMASVAQDEKGHTASTLLRATIGHYRALGISVQRVMTDNGSAYRSCAFREACKELPVPLA